MENIEIRLDFFAANSYVSKVHLCFVLCQVDLMKNLAELSQHDQLIACMKDIATHVLSADNMRSSSLLVILSVIKHDCRLISVCICNYIITPYVINVYSSYSSKVAIMK